MKYNKYLFILIVPLLLQSCSPSQEDLAPDLKELPKPANNNSTTPGVINIPCQFPRNDSLYINYTVSGSIVPPPKQNFIVGNSFREPNGSYTVNASSTTDRMSLTFYNEIGQISEPISGTYNTIESGSAQWRVQITGRYGGSTFTYRALFNQKIYVTRSLNLVEVHFCGINTTWQVFSNVGSMNIQGKVMLNL